MFKRVSKVFFISFAAFVMTLFFTTAAMAAPMNKKVKLTQPNGVSFNGIIRGDEYFSWNEAETGEIIAQGEDNYWYYAKVVDGQITAGTAKYKINSKPQGVILGKNIGTLIKNATIKPFSNTDRKAMSSIMQGRKEALSNRQELSENNSDVQKSFPRPNLGDSEPLLTLLVSFKDIEIHYDSDKWSKMFFGNRTSTTEAPTLNDFYNEASAGKFQFSKTDEKDTTPINNKTGKVGDGIVHVKLDYNHPNTDGPSAPYSRSKDYGHYRVNRSQKMWTIVHDALVKADEYIDFAALDKNKDGNVDSNELHLVVITAGFEVGGGDPAIWPHSFALFDIASHPEDWDSGLPDMPYDAKNYVPALDGVTVCDGYNGGNYTMEAERIGNGAKAVVVNGKYDHCIDGGVAYEDNPSNYNYYGVTLGVFCHELGHSLGLPDEYDYGYDSCGIGSHSLMANGDKFAFPGGLPGSGPGQPDAFCKYLLHWGQIIEVTPEAAKSAKGDFKLYAASVKDKDGKYQYNMLKIPTSDPMQFFLVENRNFSGSDYSLKQAMKSGGLLIEHVDERQWDLMEKLEFRPNDDQYHKYVDVEEANEGKLGYSQLDSNIDSSMVTYDHYYYAGGVATFGIKSIPNSNLYNGTVTGISVTAKSKPGTEMVANVVPTDLTPPTIVSFNPAIDSISSYVPTIIKNTNKIEIKFSEPVQANNGGEYIWDDIGETNDYENLGWVYIYSYEPVSRAAIALIKSEIQIKGNVVTLYPEEPFKPGILYRLRLAKACVKDMAGNVFYPDERPGSPFIYEKYFRIQTTAKDTGYEKVAPVVKNIYPGDKTLATNDTVLFNFSEAVFKGASFNKITVTDDKKKPVQCDLTLNYFKLDATTIAELLEVAPKADLAPNTTYTVSIPAGAFIDACGNANKAFTYTFKTGAGPAAAPANLEDILKAQETLLNFEEVTEPSLPDIDINKKPWVDHK